MLGIRTMEACVAQALHPRTGSVLCMPLVQLALLADYSTDCRLVVAGHARLALILIAEGGQCCLVVAGSAELASCGCRSTHSCAAPVDLPHVACAVGVRHCIAHTGVDGGAARRRPHCSRTRQTRSRALVLTRLALLAGKVS